MSVHLGGNAAPSGTVSFAVTRDLGDLATYQPTVRKAPWTWHLRNWLQYRFRELPALACYRFLGRLTGMVWIESCLSAQVLHGDGTITDYGVVSRRVVTTAGVNYLVDAFQGTTEPENMKYHAFGTGTTAENASDTALVTELTTEYAGNVRPTGSTTEGASANIYRSVGTLTPDSGGSIVLREHALCSANAAGTVWDRSVFAAVTVDSAAGDSCQVTYDCTFAAGS